MTGLLSRVEILSYLFPDALSLLRQDWRYEELTEKTDQKWGLQGQGKISLKVEGNIAFDEPAFLRYQSRQVPELSIVNTDRPFAMPIYSPHPEKFSIHLPTLV